METIKNVNGNDFASLKKHKTSDFQKFWNTVINNKYLFIVSFISCLIAAYLVNRYSTAYYMVKSTLLIRESESTNDVGNLMLSKEGEGVPGTTLDKTQEVAILSSYPFIYKTISALDLRVSYFHQGKIGEVEMYGNLPFKVFLPDTSKANLLAYNQYEIAFTDKGHFVITELSSSKNVQTLNALTGQTIIFNKCPIVISATKYFNPSKDIGRKYKIHFHNLSDLARAYKYNLSVTSEDKSSILELEFKTTVPQKGIDFLNECTKQYLKEKYEEKSRSASQALAFINEQINNVKGSLGNTESTIATFKASNTFSDPAEMTSRNLDALAGIEDQKATLSLNERYYSSMLSDLNNNADPEQLVAPSSIGIQDDMTDNLIKQLADMQIEKNSYAASGNSKNPLVQELDIKINNTKTALKQNLRTLALNNRVKLNQLGARAGQYQAKVFNIPIAEKRFTDLKRVGDFNDNLYQFLMQKKVEAGILKASATVENKIVEGGFLVSHTPLSPKKANNYALAVLIGFIFPFSFIKAKDALNKKLTGKDEIQENSSIPIIGNIYHNLDASPFVINTGSRTAVSESIRMLRSNLVQLTRNKSKKIFLLTSTNSGEGKSFTSINIANSFAIAKKKTILINLDLRVPSEAYKQISNEETGISAFLEGTVAAKDIIQKTSIPFLDYIPTGELPVNPAELLMDGELENLFEYLRSLYDYIIVDTPPLTLVADSLIIANYSDLNILVVREKYTLKQDLNELNQMYKEGKIKEVVMVINDVHLSKKGYKNAYYYKS
jgi:capsular exopolysaccharide synthesis family protein